jgi:diaminopimelate epimerase
VRISFIKIEGLGNDYIYVDGRAFSRFKGNRAALVRAISDRRKGVGSDGVIIIERNGANSARMIVYNSDGSEARFCGNGLRGVALYLRSVHGSRSRNFSISTRWNNYYLEVVEAQTGSAIVRASLGSPSFDCREIGIRGDTKNCLGIEVELNGIDRIIYCVAMPNPHAVTFINNFDFDWRNDGATLENSPLFRVGVNVMFTKVVTSKKIEVRPWERGSGATAACGSGAAAATVISSLLGYVKGDVTAIMPGGSLNTRWDIEDNQVYQEGPTRIAFSGIYNP